MGKISNQNYQGKLECFITNIFSNDGYNATINHSLPVFRSILQLNNIVTIRHIMYHLILYRLYSK